LHVMFVIPVVLSEKEVPLLPDSTLLKLAICSKDEVLVCIEKYLADENANVDVKERVYEAYKERLLSKRFLKSEEVKEHVSSVGSLDYEDITASQEISVLRDWEKSINEILSNQHAIPYIEPIRSCLLQELRKEAKALSKEVKELKRFAKMLEKYGYLFRDSVHASYRGTVVKNVIRNREKYEIMLRGIKFLIEKKESGVDPRSWRFL